MKYKVGTIVGRWYIKKAQSYGDTILYHLVSTYTMMGATCVEDALSSQVDETAGPYSAAEIKADLEKWGL